MNTLPLTTCPDCDHPPLKTKTFTYYSSHTCTECHYCEEHDVDQSLKPEYSRVWKSIGFSNQYSDRHITRAMYERFHGTIPKGWELHHIDRNPTNNTLTNLAALPREVHKLIHVDISLFPTKQSLRDTFPELNL